MSNRILVLGATGHIGESLVKQLRDKPGVSISVLARDPEKAKKLFGSDGKVAVLKGDVTELSTVETALKEGFDRVFILTNAYEKEGGIARASKAANVKQIVKISCWLAGTHQEPGSIFAQHAQAEIDVAASGVPWVFLRPADFMSNLLHHAATVKSMGKFFGAHGHAQIGSIDPADIAACAAGVLSSDPAVHNFHTYTLTGPDALTFHELAAEASKVLGKHIEYVDVGDAAHKNAMVQHKIPERVSWLLMNLSQVYRLYLHGNRYTTGNVEVITGRKPHHWHEYLAAQKEHFV